MRCRDVQQFASALVDGELDAATALEFERHVGMCEACRTRTESERLIKRELRRRLQPPRAPEALRRRIELALEDVQAGRPVAPVPSLPPVIASSSAEPPPIRLRRFVPFAAAAGLALFFASPGQWLGARDATGGSSSQEAAMGGPLFLSDVAGKHSLPLPVEVDGPNPERVAHWFEGKVAFPVRPPVFSQPMTKLVGGRISWVRNQPAAHLVYDFQGRRVSVLIFAPPRRRFPMGIPGLCVPGRNVYVGHSRGVNVAFVQQDHIAYALASDVPEQMVLGLAAGF
jgi:anti-sigma factor RsiW